MNAETRATVQVIYMDIKRNYFDAADEIATRSLDYQQAMRDSKELINKAFKPYIEEAETIELMFGLLSDRYGDSSRGPCIRCKEWNNGEPTRDCDMYLRAKELYKAGRRPRHVEVSEENDG